VSVALVRKWFDAEDPELRTIIKRVLHSAAAAAAAACVARSPFDAACAPVNISTENWQLVDVGEFSFRLPPGFAEREARGIDSFVGAYRSSVGDAEVSFDLGRFSSSLPDQPENSEYRRCDVVIDDRPATVVTGELSDPSYSTIGGTHFAAAAWRNIRDTERPRHLTVSTVARDADMIPQLLAVLYSVDIDDDH
jgi:hypothetical protein